MTFPYYESVLFLDLAQLIPLQYYNTKNDKDRYLEIFLKRRDCIFSFAELLETGCQALDGIILVLALGREKDIIQLE